MDLTKLRTELTTDPLGRGYAGKAAADAAADGNEIYRTRPRPTMTGSAVLNAIDTTEWLALEGDDRQAVWNIIHLGTLDPFGIEATLMIQAFGAESQTIQNLATARQEPISRWAELGLGSVREGTIQQARAI
jgi:hypothetical protein